MAAEASGAKRINRGRGHSYSVDGKPFMGVTTAINKALPKPALTAWAAREVAELVVRRREILKELDDSEIVDLLKGAPFRERDKAANRGTEVHRLAQKLSAGEEVEVPEDIVGHVDAYIGFLETFKPADALIEVSVFNRQYRYAGTADLVCSIDKLGKRCLLDLKTNRSGPFGETALQLAAYGNAEFYVDADRQEQPMPPIDFYGVVWIRADGFDLYPYEVTEREWKQFLYCLQTAWWVENRMEKVRQDALWRRQRQEVTA
jgi:hypothetical protein